MFACHVVCVMGASCRAARPVIDIPPAAAAAAAAGVAAG
jgi:hypothetical protein